MKTGTEELREAMHRAGLDYAGPIIADGRLHRFKADGDHNRNSWFVLFPGNTTIPAAGAFGCWKRGFQETWSAKCREKLSDAAWQALREGWKRADEAREQVEKERQAKARKTAAWILSRAKPVAAHGYLTDKGVRAHGELKQNGDLLVLPLCDLAGQLHSLQFIAPDKRFGGKRNKTFLVGGRVAGCFFTVADSPDGALVICEGYATGASVHEATGLAVVCAMDSGNLLAVSKAFREKFPVREVIIAADCDAWTDGNPGLTKATETAKAIGARLAVPQFRDTTTRPTDFNDLHQLEGLDAVKAQIEAATLPTETIEETLDRLAKLPPIEYDRCREAEAKRLNARVNTLDEEVRRRRPKQQTTEAVQGSKVTFPQLEPWPEPVNGVALFNEIAATIKRFIVAPTHAIVAATLFVLHTYAFDLGDISPILFITGPTKRCGKSKYLGVLLRLVAKPFAASSATAAGIYRIIELHHPTLCIDEVDSFVHGDEQLRGLVNSGHTRDAAFHLGCSVNGDKDFEPRRWSTWAPKVFSGIGRLADTIEDRAIIVKMVRRRKNEPCERLRFGMTFEDIRRRALRFINDHKEEIQNNTPPVPDALHDRAADNWTPLFILADLAGGDWPKQGREAAIALSDGKGGATLDFGEQLLADICAIFKKSGADKMLSRDLTERLNALEDRPWADFGKSGRAITMNQVAELLKSFQVFSRSVRVGKETGKGYYLDDFADAFSHWAAEYGLPKGDTVTTPVNIGENLDFQNVTAKSCDVSENGVSTNKDAGCDAVTFQKGGTLENEAMLL